MKVKELSYAYASAESCKSATAMPSHATTNEHLMYVGGSCWKLRASSIQDVIFKRLPEKLHKNYFMQLRIWSSNVYSHK